MLRVLTVLRVLGATGAAGYRSPSPASAVSTFSTSSLSTASTTLAPAPLARVSTFSTLSTSLAPHVEAVMNRRDALGTLSVGGASLLASSQSLAECAWTAPPRLSRRPWQARRPQDPRHQDDPDGAQSDPPGDRQGRDDRARPRRLGLRHLHATRAGRPDGPRRSFSSRFSSVATSTRSKTSGNRAM